MSFTKVAPAGIGTSPGNSILIGDSLLHSTGIDIGSNTGAGVTIRQHGDATFTGIITASAFFGDGSGLEGVSSSGIGTPLSDDDTSELNKVYYVNQDLSIGSTVTVNHPSSAVASYTHYQDLVVTDDADFIVADGDTFIPDVLGIRTSTSTISSASGGRIRAGTITNAGANGAPNFPNGLTGTAGTFTGNLNVGGVLTYEDVTNVDSVGIVTARAGINLVGNDLNVGSNIKIGNASGIVTATSYRGDGSQLSGISVDPSAAASSSGFLKVLNASTPQIRLNNDASDGATTRAFFGIATGSNNYINGSVANDTVLSARSGGDLLIGCGSTVRMKIDELGRVTKPNTPAFFATHGGNSASGSTGYITYNTAGAYYNNGGHFDTSNGRFTAPITGIYHFHFHCFVHNTATQTNVEIIMRRFNSGGGGQTTLTRGFDNKVNGNYGPPVSIAWTGPLTATQYVQIYSVNELHHANGYYFGGYLIG